MKILMTLMGLNIGGAETHVVELTKELCRRGHQVIVASNGGVYEAALAEAGASHVQIPLNRRSAGAMLQSVMQLRRLIRQEQPDLVHTHARIPAFLCGILQKTMKFPFITSAHWVFQVTPLLRLMTNWGSRTVAVSRDIQDYLEKHYQLPRDQISVTINGIDTVSFSGGPGDEELKKELGLGDGPVIGTVTRLDADRAAAAQRLIAIMPELLQNCPDAQLLIVGSGDMTEQLTREAACVNRAAGKQAVILAGPRTNVPDFIRLCHIFVGASRAVLEAMACSCPVILAGNEGYMGILSEEKFPLAQESNFCYRGAEPIEDSVLLRDILTLLALPALEKERLGAFGRDMVLQHYSVARMTDDYMAAYDALLHPKKVVRAAVSGYYGYGNLGDDAILEAMRRQLSDTGRPVRLTVLSRKPEETKNQYGLPAVQRFSTFGVYRTLKKSDVLISGGGSLLQDKTSTRSLLYYLAVIRLAKKLKKPVFLYANGIGPLSQEKNRKRVKKVLARCDGITLRDKTSLEELKNLGLDREDIVVTGDPVFALKPEKKCAPAAWGLPEAGSFVGISVRTLPDGEGFIAEFARLCDRLSQEMGKTIVFLVMQQPGDERISQRIRQTMEEPSCLVKTPGDPEAMLSLIERMDLVISLRLHTLIFAAAVGVPMVGCIYDPKVKALLETLRMPNCGTPETMEAEEAYKIVTDLLERLPEEQERLRAMRANLSAGAAETGRIFKTMLN